MMCEPNQDSAFTSAPQRSRESTFFSQKVLTFSLFLLKAYVVVLIRNASLVILQSYKSVPLLHFFFIYVYLVSYLVFVLPLFIPHLFISCLSRAKLHDGGISWVSLLILLLQSFLEPF